MICDQLYNANPPLPNAKFFRILGLSLFLLIDAKTFPIARPSKYLTDWHLLEILNIYILCAVESRYNEFQMEMENNMLYQEFVKSKIEEIQESFAQILNLCFPNFLLY